MTTETSQVPKSPKSEIIADIVKDLKDITAEGCYLLLLIEDALLEGAALRSIDSCILV